MSYQQGREELYEKGREELLRRQQREELELEYGEYARDRLQRRVVAGDPNDTNRGLRLGVINPEYRALEEALQQMKLRHALELADYYDKYHPSWVMF